MLNKCVWVCVCIGVVGRSEVWWVGVSVYRCGGGCEVWWVGECL